MAHIYDDDQDRQTLLSTLEQIITQFNWTCHAWRNLPNGAAWQLQRYAQFVAEHVKAASPWSSLKGQVFLDDAQLVQRMQIQLQSRKDDVQNLPCAALSPIASISRNRASRTRRNAGIVAGYVTAGYS